MALQTAYVLHRRPYRENSQIVELFGVVSGRVAAMVRCSKNRRNAQAPVEPFLPLLTDWLGNSELKTIKSFEAAGLPIKLKGQALYAGLYLNELLIRLLHKEEPHASLFHLYEATLQALADGEDLEPVLRQFELGLLATLGYGVELSSDNAGQPIQDDMCYQLGTEQGWLPMGLTHEIDSNKVNRFTGLEIKTIAIGDWSDMRTRQAAKRLCRLALAPLLGNKPLRSRELFKRGKNK